MPVKREIPYDHGHFFITFTCHKWLPLIAITGGYDLIYNWFDLLKKKGHFITGFVIMPNHLHATIAFRKTDKSINRIIGDGKRFMAYAVIKRLNEMDRNDILTILQNSVTISDKKRGKLHEVWQDSFDWKACVGDAFTMQKIDYMHNNPFSGKWHLTENAIEYDHSSARSYICGEQGKYSILDFKSLQDINLSS